MTAIGSPLTRRPLLATALALVLAGCTAGDDGAKVALPPLEAPSPSPSPLPPLQPVAGSVEATTTHTSFNERLGIAEDGEPAPGSVQAATAAVAAALDAWLGSAQADAPDLAPLRGAWLAQEDPAAAEVLRSGITNGDNPVATAAYRFDVHLEPDPTLVVADVTVDRRDGTTVRVEMVFDVTEGQHRLHVVGAPGAA